MTREEEIVEAIKRHILARLAELNHSAACHLADASDSDDSESESHHGAVYEIGEIENELRAILELVNK
jgi:hypothetical protein